MATQTGGTEYTGRELWQAPVFLAGLLAVTAVWASRPYWKPTPPKKLEQELAAARQALDAAPPESDRAISLAARVLERGGDSGALAGPATFVLGSAYGNLAAKTGGAGAGNLWAQSRQHLERAEGLDVPAADRARLRYRLAKALFHLDAEPQRVVDYLATCVESAGEDQAEGYGLLAQAYLRLPQPDVEAALQANKKQLSLRADDESVLAPARLLRARLLLQMQAREEARSVLADIKRTAPPAVFSQARALLAICCQEDGLWDQAAPIWEEIWKEKDTAAGKPEQVLYALGVCLSKLNKTDEAAKCWQLALSFTGPEAQAAAFRLAELRLTGDKPGTAVECIERGMRDVAKPETYQNPLVSRDEARALVERACQVLRTAGDFNAAQQLARMHEKLADAVAAQTLFAEAAEAWGKERQGSGRLDEAHSHFVEAAAAYKAVADLTPMPAEAASWIWKSADCSIQAADYPAAIAALKRYLTVEKAPEKLGEGWFVLGQVYHDYGDKANADAAYRKTLEYQGRYSFRARFQLAVAQVDDGKKADAESALEQNLELMRYEADLDQEAHEKTLFTLAKLMYERGAYRPASLRLQEGLDRYPANPRALIGRLQLAECHRLLAAQESQSFTQPLGPEARQQHREQYRVELESAVTNYQKLLQDLAARQAGGVVSDTDRVLFKQAGFALGACLFDLGQYAEALQQYRGLVKHYQGKVECLVALQHVWRCYSTLRKPDEAKATVREMAGVLKALDDAAFKDRQEPETREALEQWLAWAAAQQIKATDQ